MERAALALLFVCACSLCPGALGSANGSDEQHSEEFTIIKKGAIGRSMDADSDLWEDWILNEVGASGDFGPAKSRKRRFIAFPTGSTLKTKLTLTIPVEGISDTGSLEVIGEFTYNLPNETIFDAPTSSGMSYAQSRQDRHTIYHRMESFLDDLGYDGHTCTLRTLCEINETPFEHGVYGDVMNLIMQVSPDPDKSGGYDDYMTAEYYGRNYGDCGDIYKSCPHSVLDYVTHAL